MGSSVAERWRRTPGCSHDVRDKLARTNIRVFLGDQFDAIITNAAGCGSTLKEYRELLPVTDSAHEEASRFSAKVRDVTEFLDELGMIAPLGEVHLASPGFLPFIAWAKGPRSSAAADSCCTRCRAGGNALGG